MDTYMYITNKTVNIFKVFDSFQIIVIFYLILRKLYKGRYYFKSISLGCMKQDQLRDCSRLHII